MLKLETRCQKTVTKLTKNLKILREKMGVSKNELSQRSGVSRSSIRKIEEGESSPSLYIILLLTNSLGLSLGELLAEIERSYKS